MTERSCGDCRLCCKMVAVYELGTEPEPYTFTKPPNVWCEHAKPSGCAIWADDRRPTACRTFACEWLRGNGSDRDRPDRSRILVYTGRRDLSPTPGGPSRSVALVNIVECLPGVLDTPRGQALIDEALARIHGGSTVESGVAIKRYHDVHPSAIQLCGHTRWITLSIPRDAPPVYVDGDEERSLLVEIFGEVPRGSIDFDKWDPASYEALGPGKLEALRARVEERVAARRSR